MKNIVVVHHMCGVRDGVFLLMFLVFWYLQVFGFACKVQEEIYNHV